ncbi:hypothetical protein [Sulfolobus acidocaldarius]|uniref:hypothetical protein n=1 Tax=Sulfolobus acidocaldarius TaxID=2285 RepID=UPI000A7F7FEC|nr:hypothetical protein [Sulfolobus acidocaldarius]
MKATVTYYKPEEIPIVPGLVGIKVIKVQEEQIEYRKEEELENIERENLIVYIVSNNGLRVVNGLKSKYALPEPLKLLRIGVPKEVNSENITFEYVTFFDKDYVLIGFYTTYEFDKPFVVLEFEKNQTKIISKSENDRAEVVTNQKVKKKTSKKKKRKKSAKKSSSKRKIKGKSTRKS